MSAGYGAVFIRDRENIFGLPGPSIAHTCTTDMNGEAEFQECIDVDGQDKNNNRSELTNLNEKWVSKDTVLVYRINRTHNLAVLGSFGIVKVPSCYHGFPS